jgi:Fic family protein
VGGLPLPVEAEGIWEGIWHEETHHSTAMEGNTLVLRQVKALLEEGRAVGNKDLREYLEIEGYGDAAKWVYANAIRGQDTHHPLITIGELRDIHKLVMDPVWSRFPDEHAKPDEGPGGFRQCEIQPLRPGLSGAPWVHVHALLNGWLADVNQGPVEGEHFLYYVARLHAAFERIHPFRDGNGRARDASRRTCYSSVQAHRPRSSTRREGCTTSVPLRVLMRATRDLWLRYSHEPYE